jgi:hypothetical protein
MTLPLPDSFDHDAWQTAFGTLLGYGLILLVLFLALFVVPFLLFETIGVA